MVMVLQACAAFNNRNDNDNDNDNRFIKHKCSYELL